MGQSAGWNVVWSLCLSRSFCLPLEIQFDGTVRRQAMIFHVWNQLVKCLHKILLFYKHYVVGTGGEACVPSQIDGELTSETARAQEVLTWKGFSKRYEAMFMSKWQLFGLTSLTYICGLESSARATANNKCPENRDAFQSCFFFFYGKDSKSSNCLIQVISLVRKWFMMGPRCTVLYTRSLKTFNGRAFSSPLSIYFSTRRNSDGASVKTNHLRAKWCRSINSKQGMEQSVNRAVPALFISLLNWVCHLHLTSRWPWLFNSNVWLCYK